MADTPPIDVHTDIEDCPVVQTNVLWPAPVDKRLDELVKKIGAVSAGDISRSRLLAALVADAPDGGSDLDDLVRQYRTLTAGAVLRQETGTIEFRERKPGRRSRRT